MAGLGLGLGLGCTTASRSELVCCDRSPANTLAARIEGAHALLTNKVVLGREALESVADTLGYVGVTATGYSSVVDLPRCADLGIAVTSVPAYSTSSVTQFVISFILYHHTAIHVHAVGSKDWPAAPDFCLSRQSVLALEGRTLAILGKGDIGSSVGRAASALGMNTIYAQTRDQSNNSGTTYSC